MKHSGTGDTTLCAAYDSRIDPWHSPALTTSAMAGIHANMVGTPWTMSLAVRVRPGYTAPCAARLARGVLEGDSATSRLSRAQ